ncbi:IGS10 protein, partial [Smithornis capensis]|nr:IGS10 protein [Smithornis capensis]
EDGRIIVLRTGMLTLRTADVFDTGLYHCIGTNDNDADTLTFRITVVDPHVEHDGVNGARLSMAVGSTLLLPCTSTAAPDAAITWVLPGHTIFHHSVGNKHIFDNGTLRIQGVTERDSGYFQCIAANQYGVDLLVFQVLVRQDETTLKKKVGATGEWEEGDGSGNTLLGSGVSQTHLSATPATLTAHLEFAASTFSSRGAQGANQSNSHRKMPHRPYRDRTVRRFRGHRRQFVSSAQRVDPQRWAALLKKIKRNSTVTDKQGEVATEQPIQVRKFSDVPGDEEETSGDFVSPEEEFMMPVTERAPVPALGRGTESVITAGPEGSVSHTSARKTSLLVTEAVTPLPSPLSQSVSPGSRRPQMYPKPTDSRERSDLSQISANDVKQSTVSSKANRTSTLFPAGKRLVYSGQSNNQHLKFASTTPMTEATGTSKAVAPQNAADKLRVFTESTGKVSTKTDHWVPVVAVSAPSSGLVSIYFHTVQKGGTSKPSLASTMTTHQQNRVIQGVPTPTPQLQQQYEKRRKISGQRRIVRPGHIPTMKEHRYNFGRPGCARGSTSVAAGVKLNKKCLSKVSTLNNLSSSINSFSPEAPLSSPSTMNMPMEHPVGTHQNTLFLKEEENKHSTRQKAATTVMSVTAKGTAATCNPIKLLGMKPTVTPATTSQSDTRIAKSKIFKMGGRRGQRRKRPPKTSALQHVTAAHNTATTSTVSTATTVVTAVTSPALPLPPSLTPAKPLSASVRAISTTEMPMLWIPDTPEAPQHVPMAATQTLVTSVTQSNTQLATSLPTGPPTHSLIMACQTTSVTLRNTQLITSPPAQTPTKVLQIPPWLDEPPGAAVDAMSESAPAQHIRATTMARGESYLKMGESVIQENQAAQPTFPVRTVSSTPAAVTDTTIPRTQHPTPLQ